MLKKQISPELYGFLRSIQPERIPEEHQVEIANLGILNIFCVQNHNIHELCVYGNYIIELSDGKYVDMTAPLSNIGAIIEQLSE